MASFVEAIGESINRAACVVLGNYVASEELLRYIVEPFSTGNDYNSSRFLYNQRCNAAPPSPPPPPFTGGQCSTLYTVNLTFTVNRGLVSNPGGLPPDVQTRTANYAGAISGLRVSNQANSASLFIQHAGTESGIFNTNFATPNDTTITDFAITSVARVDGLPDNCGSPPPIIPPYQSGDNTYVDSPTYINNEGDTVNIPVSITLGYADIDFNGTLSFPVDLDFELNPELNVSGTLNFNTGDFNVGVNNPRGSGGSPGLPPGGYGTNEEPVDPTIPADEAPPAPLPDEDPPEREEVIAGCVVIVEQLDGKESIVFQGDNPDLILPCAGYVQFLIRVGNLSGWTEPIPVKSSRAFIPCPWEPGAYKVEGTAYYNAAIQVIPVYVQRTLQPQFPE